jgi:hypothetical protein
MRTTVTLEPDAEQIIRRTMRERGITFKQAINEAIRRGQMKPAPERRATFPTYAMGEPKVDLTKALRLAGQLEDAEIIKKMNRGS